LPCQPPGGITHENGHRLPSLYRGRILARSVPSPSITILLINIIDSARNAPSGTELVFFSRSQDPKMLTSVKARDKVKFSIEKMNGQLTVTKIDKAK
jgi:hypothetical protein